MALDASTDPGAGRTAPSSSGCPPLAEGEQCFRQFVESSDDVFWVADLAACQLLYVSPGFERLWGATAAELLADPQVWSRAVAAEDAARLPQPFFAEDPQRLAADTVREYRIVSRDGETRWIRDRRFFLRGPDGRGTRLGGVVEDITERKAREIEREELLDRERAARVEAEALASSKDEFLAVVSHELRSPLNAIRGWAHVLRQTGGLQAMQLKALDAIERNTQSQARMVDDLLDAQRILCGQLQLELRRAGLASVIDQAVETVRPAAQAKNITLEIRHDPAVGMVLLDLDRMRQAIANLISNAVKFTPEGGTVSVRSARGPQTIAVEVSDTGIGVEPAQLPFVFDRFQQADGSRTRRQGGLGLGLSLARQLIELHGGSVNAHSEGIGRGATFTIELPDRLAANELPPVLEPLPADPQAPLAHKRIVVVEDDADGREILELILRGAQAELVSFDCAARAYDYLSHTTPEQQPDAVISDIAMPDEDGYSFMQRVRAFEQRNGRPRMVAVALTAFARAEDRRRALQAGFDVHVGKPIDSTSLLETLKQVIRPSVSSPQWAASA
ncbi:ATP-binding protein [Caldimonas tepidiphila]|uniref:PAS domain-containing hybrid sensor histidine kinase/response regulator n=1 Tax=Caldimonas tepidiphila TaxID=2315841 RepID=UPI0014761982|nr:ATP-binding protein [Caldimonas tepidiphila]